LAQLQRSVAQLEGSTLPEVNRAIENVSEASRSFVNVAREFEQTPQSILWGPAPIQPGPGEPGFGGFTKE
jgi:phospholipid/cholesterol/gamma-HCH transport system substrate-binding protein